jgi:hypothetical protein
MNSREQVSQLLNSSKFCSYLEITGTVYPGGTRVPCCKASGSDIGSIPVSSISYQQYQHSDVIDSIRNDLAQRNSQSYCRACIAAENQGLASDRTNNNQNWLRYLDQTDQWNEFVQLVNTKQQGPWHWMLFLDNTCQARCVMCDSSFSTAIEQEYKKLNLPASFMTKIQPQKQADATEIQQTLEDIKSSAHNIKMIQLLGGEPTLQKPCYDILQWLIENKHSENIAIKINTNGINLSQNWLSMAQYFKSWQWTFSIDATGDLNTWIRYPTRWDTLTENINKARASGSTVIAKTTIHAMNVHFLPELWSWAQQQNLYWMYHFVEDPQDISVSVLTPAQRKQLIEKYNQYPEFVLSHGADIIKFVSSMPDRDPEPLLNFIQTLTPHRPGPFDQVNPYFTGLNK